MPPAPHRLPHRLFVALLLTCVVCLSHSVDAQYFGQNKVQYEQFDFEVMRTEHLDIYHYPEERAAVDEAARMAEAWHARLGEVLRHTLSGRQPLVLYAASPHFAQTNVVQGLIGEGTGGVTEFLKRRMAMPFASTLAETSHVLGHEMVHAFQYDMGGQGALRLPLWFVEGMAEYLSLGADHPQTAMWLRDAVRRDAALPGFDQLNDPRLFPYRYGHAAWAYLAGRLGDAAVAELYIRAARTGDPIGAIEALAGEDIDTVSAAWHAAILDQYGGVGDITALPGRLLVGEDGPARINVSPALSPDGRWLVFLSERDLFSIDLFLADAATGEVVRKLTETTTNAHFESLQFIDSAGAWNRASDRFAFIGVSRGHPVLRIITPTGAVVAEHRLDDLDDAWHPSWSPDGTSIVMSGMVGGLSNLYLYELDARRLTALTDDRFAALQPAWSPSGEVIAFVTDRFSTDLETQQFGNYRLAQVDVRTREVTPLPTVGDGKHINPQWNREGDGLFVIAEPDGVSNVYAVDIASGRTTQVTGVVTGIAGITGLSPAVSYAPEVDRLAFSVYGDNGYTIRTVDAPATTAAPTATPAVAQATRLPGGAGGNGLVARAIASAVPPLPAAPAVEDYSPDLSLDLFGATGGIGVGGGGGLGRSGAFASGGLSMLFSDMLGRHTIGAVALANGELRDLGGLVTYLNSTSRWNWGAVGQAVPYVTGAFTRTAATIDGRPVILDQEQRFRQFEVAAAGVAQYPFSRALRFEVQSGLRRLGFSREIRTQIFDRATGQYLGEDREDLDAPSALNLLESTAALVYDQTVFGPTSPIVGQRYRMEVAPTFGALRMTNVTLDYRRYLSPVRPLTLAVRGLHIARYGRDADDSRLSPLFLGYPFLMRGYELGSFERSECPAAADDCPVFDQLVGSRNLIGNVELRFPLLGLFSGEYRYGGLPVEGFAFADSGVAWTADVDPSFAGGSRNFVSSVGGGVRINAFGYAVVSLTAARPLDRPGRGWVFGFQLAPGF